MHASSNGRAELVVATNSREVSVALIDIQPRLKSVIYAWSLSATVSGSSAVDPDDRKSTC